MSNVSEGCWFGPSGALPHVPQISDQPRFPGPGGPWQPPVRGSQPQKTRLSLGPLSWFSRDLNQNRTPAQEPSGQWEEGGRNRSSCFHPNSFLTTRPQTERQKDPKSPGQVKKAPTVKPCQLSPDAKQGLEEPEKS